MRSWKVSGKQAFGGLGKRDIRRAYVDVALMDIFCNIDADHNSIPIQELLEAPKITTSIARPIQGNKNVIYGCTACVRERLRRGKWI